jgi:hypothetical protein
MFGFRIETEDIGGCDYAVVRNADDAVLAFGFTLYGQHVTQTPGVESYKRLGRRS